MASRLGTVCDHLQHYGHNEVFAEEKDKIIAQLFAEKVRASIPQATDEQIAELQNVLRGGELRLMTCYDLFPKQPIFKVSTARGFRK